MNFVLNVLKPPFMTSSDMVADVRRMLAQKRVGHAGTLDPGAAGVLPVCVGKATRLFDYLVDKRKGYLAEIAFGVSTDTGDSYGKVTARAQCEISRGELLGVLPGFQGAQSQRIPMYSAAKSGGKRLYELARAGQSVHKEKQVRIESVTLLDQTGKNRFLLEIFCSRGTYIRTLLEDIGAAVNAPAYTSFLLRTQSGVFSLADALTLPEWQARHAAGELELTATPMDAAVAFLPMLRFDREDRKRLVNGVRLPARAEDGTYRVYAGTFIGLGMIEKNILRITALLCDGAEINER